MNALKQEAPEPLLSLEEFERLPEEDEFIVELVRGRVLREPRPLGLRYGLIATQLLCPVGSYVEERRNGVALARTGFLLEKDPPTVRCPVMSFIAAEKLSAGIPKGWPEFPPDLAVEIVTPSTTAEAIQEKVLEYLEKGSRLVWVVVPRTRSLTTWRPKRDVRLLLEGDILEGADVLPGFRLPVSEIFEMPEAIWASGNVEVPR
ncbi:MAG: Uma2 family endonuclease [Gemmatimonadota bacterium]